MKLGEKITTSFCGLRPTSSWRKRCWQRKELQRLRALPRLVHDSTNIMGKTLHIADGLSFCNSYEEIFLDKVYSFSSETNSPFIVDCGANVGLSLIFFKQIYPDARILAFEADPKIFRLLEQNVTTFDLSNITLNNSAVWTSSGKTGFISRGADTGRVSNESREDVYEVPSIRLHDHMKENIDLLKIDIEGAETSVISDISDKLDLVRNILVEYHSFKNEPQVLDKLIRCLRKSGFRIQIQTVYADKQPLLVRRGNQDMDLQLNIFGYRANNESTSY